MKRLDLLGVIFGIFVRLVHDVLTLIWQIRVHDVLTLSIYFYEILVLFIVGIFGLCIFFAGLVMAWMGWDDYKMSKEMEDTEESEEEEEEESSSKEMESASELVCEVCGKVAKSQAGLSAHMRTHK